MKRRNVLLAVACVAIFALGLSVYAAGDLSETKKVIGGFSWIVNTLSGIAAAAALLAFFWGIAKYISSAGDPKKAQEGKSIMIYGVVALFVLFSIFGLVRFLQIEFGTTSTGNLTPPQVAPVTP